MKLPKRLTNHYNRISSQYKMLKTKLKIIEIVKKSKIINLELGAGNKSGTGNWKTIDITNNWDLFWDLTKGIPFPTNSINMIYSSHVLEHFTYREGQRLLTECLRVLKNEGVFSISVPNAQLFIDAYFNNKKVEDIKHSFFKPAFYDISKLDYVNYIAYMNEGHKYMFDEEHLVSIYPKKDLDGLKVVLS